MNHYFQQARFTQSATTPKTLPPEAGFEVAFAGRSNSGKSSSINRICSQRSLARTSKTPGRTQLINFFALPQGEYLVDLPGYGYAKVPEAIKLEWQRFINDYLTKRKTLKGLIIVMDIRHPLTEHDSMLLQWAAARNLPVHILLNKADKLKRGAIMNELLAVRKKLQEFNGNITVQTFSAQDGLGLDVVWAKLEEWLERSQNTNDSATIHN
ncbi:ribosome biogenesis GTP-binding protein YihA/YsxC [Thiofilum flexile]|uniref:ribosome biogenesis GTP-binding protein YihA/YsxC n=1 Tax=Thiofilum flexile TaxID=125627 RepID=UPI00035E4DD4|nr:ribosome biogenesis GTP-binding protein YihA/YsxC [Thiofilum flexile]